MSVVTQTSDIFARFVDLIEKKAESDPFGAMERANRLLYIAGHDRAQGTNVSLPPGTEELIAKIDREVAKRVEALRAQHLDELVSSLQAKREELRLNAESAGYHLAYQN